MRVVPTISFCDYTKTFQLTYTITQKGLVKDTPLYVCTYSFRTLNNAEHFAKTNTDRIDYKRIPKERGFNL